MIFLECIGSRASLSAINIENQCVGKLTPDFTFNNVKSGVLVLFNSEFVFEINNGLHTEQYYK